MFCKSAAKSCEPLLWKEGGFLYDRKWIKKVDVILFLVDISKGFGKGDKFILDKFKEKDAVVFLLLNKIDLVKDKSVLYRNLPHRE